MLTVDGVDERDGRLQGGVHPVRGVMKLAADPEAAGQRGRLPKESAHHARSAQLLGQRLEAVGKLAILKP